GLMGRLDAKLEPYTKSGGIIEGRTSSLQNTLTGIDEQREQLERRLSSMETRLLAQFNAMDSLVANLSSTSSYLTGQLANLPGVVRET
ncbi:MAG: flagellar filament capping protein FliD, partial [Pseudomonadota bacterium]|nr:flagellar filament capping protein FliD [Pseudomonadota bacterium]